MIDFIRFNEQSAQLDSSLPRAGKITGCEIDGLDIRIYEPKDTVEEVLVVYHGGGANSEAGYDILARQVSHDGAVCVCLTDIRGHGRSTGERGKTSHPQRIWRDVDTVLRQVRATFPGARIHLLGHSSGGGMLINYFTRYTPTQKSDSLILLAPEFGPFAPAKIRRRVLLPFASVKTWPFVLNALSGGLLCGDQFAVTLNFPEEVLALKPGFVRRYSVNMANALTPRHPAKQLAALPLPVIALFAGQDELYDARLTAEFVQACGNQNLRSGIVQHSQHLGCMFTVSEEIRRHVRGIAGKSEA